MCINMVCVTPPLLLQRPLHPCNRRLRRGLHSGLRLSTQRHSKTVFDTFYSHSMCILHDAPPPIAQIRVLGMLGFWDPDLGYALAIRVSISYTWRAEICTTRYSSRFKNNCFAVMRCSSKEGSYSRLVDFCITQP